MSKYAERVADLSAEQRVLLEMRLQKKRLAGGAAALAARMPQQASSAGDRDDENLVFSEARGSVENLLGEFYGRFPWPWQPMTFHSLTPPDFGIAMLNQDLGDWDHSLIQDGARIWVAGCGTNQALLTAMRFPNAWVTGSDVSVASLEVCERNARQMGVRNLDLKEESINQTGYYQDFDYVICTGVIHHNNDPQATLGRLAQALKLDGVMELMVYNRFHRSMTSGFQKAIRMLGGSSATVDFESDLARARTIANNFPPVNNQLSRFLRTTLDALESDFADLLIQPVEHSYTVESLKGMAAAAGLRLTLPCPTLYAKYRMPTIAWNFEFGDADLQEAYEALPDVSRWQITNLLLQEKSSLLWFYLQRHDCTRPVKSEQEICKDFLSRRFVKTRATQRTFIRQTDGRYEPSPDVLSFPSSPPEDSVKAIAEEANGERTMREIFELLRKEAAFTTVNHARVHLTSSAFPYLTCGGE